MDNVIQPNFNHKQSKSSTNFQLKTLSTNQNLPKSILFSELDSFNKTNLKQCFVENDSLPEIVKPPNVYNCGTQTLIAPKKVTFYIYY